MGNCITFRTRRHKNDSSLSELKDSRHVMMKRSSRDGAVQENGSYYRPRHESSMISGLSQITMEVTNEPRNENFTTISQCGVAEQEMNNVSIEHVHEGERIDEQLEIEDGASDTSDITHEPENGGKVAVSGLTLNDIEQNAVDGEDIIKTICEVRSNPYAVNEIDAENETETPNLLDDTNNSDDRSVNDIGAENETETADLLDDINNIDGRSVNEIDAENETETVDLLDDINNSDDRSVNDIGTENETETADLLDDINNSNKI